MPASGITKNESIDFTTFGMLNGVPYLLAFEDIAFACEVIALKLL